MKKAESHGTSSGRTSDASTTFSVRLAPRAVRDFDEAMDWLTAEASPEVAGRWAAVEPSREVGPTSRRRLARHNI
jgi:hypothetical protein